MTPEEKKAKLAWLKVVLMEHVKLWLKANNKPPITDEELWRFIEPLLHAQTPPEMIVTMLELHLSNDDKSKVYHDAINRMHARMLTWRQGHKTLEVLIHWRDIPIKGHKTYVVATIRDALQIGLVTVNEPGYEMLKAMCEPEEDEPTLQMVRQAIERT